MNEAIPLVLLSMLTPVTADTVSTIPAIEVSHEANIFEVPELASVERDMDQGLVVALTNTTADVAIEGTGDPTLPEVEYDFPAKSSKGKEKVFVIEPKLSFKDRHMIFEDSTLREPEVTHALALSLLSRLKLLSQMKAYQGLIGLSSVATTFCPYLYFIPYYAHVMFVLAGCSALS